MLYVFSVRFFVKIVKEFLRVMRQVLTVPMPKYAATLLEYRRKATRSTNTGWGNT